MRFQFKSVRTKLITAFVSIAALVAVVGVVGLAQQSSIAAKGKDMYNFALLPIAALGKANTAMVTAHGDLETSVLVASGAPTEQAIAAFSSQAAAATSDFATFMKVDANPSAQEQSDETGVETNFASFVSVATSKGFAIARDSNIAAFVKLDAAQLVPIFNKVQSGLDSLNKMQLDQAAADLRSANSAKSSAAELAVVLMLLAVAAAVGLGVLIGGSVAKPLGASVVSLAALAKKDLTNHLDVNTSDETARMAESLNAAVGSLRDALGSISQNSSTLAAASEELTAVATQMGANAEETSAQSNTVSAAGEQVSRSVESVASAVEEMTSSIAEIARNANEAAQVATEAVDKAAVIDADITKLGAASADIGEVVKVISSIAAQTNLLALNATIEAARAGDQGKGFAVVASEVKDLANETAHATGEIAQKIEAIQRGTQTAVGSVREIMAVINRVSQIQTTIAGAVEEQTAVTKEIGRSISEAAKGSDEIAQNINGVAQAAQSTAVGVSSTQQAAVELSRVANDLRSLVGEFRLQ
jgi:methyl-accepting chemotaxis protein